MTSRAHLEYDPMMRGARLTVARDAGGGHRQVLLWTQPEVSTLDPNADAYGVRPDERAWLTLPEDDLRAIYEALGEYFGHAGHDIRALRKDYDAERGRVDRLIGHLINPVR